MPFNYNISNFNLAGYNILKFEKKKINKQIPFFSYTKQGTKKYQNARMFV